MTYTSEGANTQKTQNLDKMNTRKIYTKVLLNRQIEKEITNFIYKKTS